MISMLSLRTTALLASIVPIACSQPTERTARELMCPPADGPSVTEPGGPFVTLFGWTCDDEATMCAGTVIGPRTVLTASHPR
jgi:hypothetical protein